MVSTVSGRTICLSAEQPSNALALTAVIFAFISTFLSDVQSRNALLPIEVALAGIFIEVRLEHPSNILEPTLVKQSGSTTDSSEAQFRNRLPGADVIFNAERLTLLSAVQPANVLLPKELMFAAFSKITVSRSRHSKNALDPPIFSTLAGITIFLSPA